MIPPSENLRCDISAILKDHDPSNKLGSYFRLLLEENSRVNLVSRETSTDDLRRLAAESLLPFDLINDVSTDRYLDIGTGGGFPAIPILLTKQFSEAVLVERTIKKAEVLNRIISSLNDLSHSNIRILNKTFEEWKSPGKFDLITLRLVRLTSPLLKKILPQLKSSGCFVYYATPENIKLPNNFKMESHRYLSSESHAAKSFTLIRRK